MKTLDEHNESVQRILKTPALAGVLCPDDFCTCQLVYVDNFILKSNPPKRKVKCPSCGYEGYKTIINTVEYN